MTWSFSQVRKGPAFTVRLLGQGDKDASGGGSASGSETVQLVVKYVKQEALAPLQGLVRSLLFGVLGALALAFGTSLLLLAALRVLETETGAFHGNLSWLPYVIVAALAACVMALAAWRIVHGPAARRRPAPKAEAGD